MKYAAGDYVVHPGQGVCKVTGVGSRKAVVGAREGVPGHEEMRRVYSLTPMTGAKVRIQYPVSRESNLRPIIDPDRARSLIEQAPSVRPDKFERQQSWTIRDHFMECMREGDTLETLRVAKTARRHMEQAVDQGKRPRECYTVLYEEARSRLLDELSVSLGKPQDYVEGLIEKSYERARRAGAVVS